METKQYIMESIIKKPSKFLIQGVNYGQKVSISLLPKDTYLVSVSFDDLGREIINIENTCPIALKTKIYQLILNHLSELDIKQYYSYSFLFLCTINKIQLINYSIETIAYGYREVKKLAKKLNITPISVRWQGEYTRQVEASFYEDIVIQNY